MKPHVIQLRSAICIVMDKYIYSIGGVPTPYLLSWAIAILTVDPIEVRALALAV